MRLNINRYTFSIEGKESHNAKVAKSHLYQRCHENFSVNIIDRSMAIGGNIKLIFNRKTPKFNVRWGLINLTYVVDQFMFKKHVQCSLIVM